MKYQYPDYPTGLNNPSWQLTRRQMQRRNPTPAETKLWEALRGHGCAGWRFRRQHGFGPYILDFYCPAAGIVVEVDGEVHDTDFAQEYDQARDEFLQAHGLRVLRFRNAQVLNSLPAVVAAIREILGAS